MNINSLKKKLTLNGLTAEILSRNLLKFSKAITYRKRLKVEEDGSSAQFDIHMDQEDETLFI
ncbi:MAG: hypothetical protein HKO93_07915 [Flavobacteriales bacterium]|nr:hypothetical protein [Flavobacteriales bacterium]